MLQLKEKMWIKIVAEEAAEGGPEPCWRQVGFWTNNFPQLTSYSSRVALFHRIHQIGRI